MVDGRTRIHHDHEHRKTGSGKGRWLLLDELVINVSGITSNLLIWFMLGAEEPYWWLCEWVKQDVLWIHRVQSMITSNHNQNAARLCLRKWMASVGINSSHTSCRSRQSVAETRNSKSRGQKSGELSGHWKVQKSRQKWIVICKIDESLWLQVQRLLCLAVSAVHPKLTFRQLPALLFYCNFISFSLSSSCLPPNPLLSSSLCPAPHDLDGWERRT